MAKKEKSEGAEKKSKRPKDPGMFRRGVQQTVKGRKVLAQFCMLCYGKKIVVHKSIGGTRNG